ncbi:hypothetical protein [Marinobacter algicola]|uniref:Uncharacterized protein n=1 Tax=Marinobacter algicola DG893 TaxID=443152 RepID=A6F0L2_9GAMM|nr:hypothetical protein [Marinobacter algicola]EDM47773.1 hypothetical protein MDG893_20674 [Marinobacter algicola DG893]
MAEQNRKTPNQRRAREAAEREVDRFIAYLQGLDTIDQIAHQGRSIMGMWADFEGRPPSGSGFSGFCMLADKLEKIRFRHVPEEFARAYDRLSRMARISQKQVEALCVDRFYRGRTKVAIDPFTEQRLEIRWNDAACGQLLGCTAKVFQRRVTKGYSQLQLMMGYREKEAA